MSACPDCGRERVETMEAFWKNPDYSCPVDVPRTECNDTNWLEVYCLEGNVSRLEAALAERDRRLEEQKDALMGAFRRQLEEKDQRIGELEAELRVAWSDDETKFAALIAADGSPIPAVAQREEPNYCPKCDVLTIGGGVCRACGGGLVTQPGVDELCACGHRYGEHSCGMKGPCGCGCKHWTPPIATSPSPQVAQASAEGWKLGRCNHEDCDPDGGCERCRPKQASVGERAAAARQRIEVEALEQASAEGHWSDCAECNRDGGYCVKHRLLPAPTPSPQASAEGCPSCGSTGKPARLRLTGEHCSDSWHKPAPSEGDAEVFLLRAWQHHETSREKRGIRDGAQLTEGDHAFIELWHAVRVVTEQHGRRVAAVVAEAARVALARCDVADDSYYALLFMAEAAEEMAR